MVKNLETIGYKTQVQPLTHFYDDYGLKADEDEEEEEEEEDDDDDHHHHHHGCGSECESEGGCGSECDSDEEMSD